MSYHRKKARVELDLHPLLAEFVTAQQRVLDSPDFKGNWREAPPGVFTPLILHALGELLAARGPDETLAKAADVANLTAFLVDAVRASTQQMLRHAAKEAGQLTVPVGPLIRRP